MYNPKFEMITFEDALKIVLSQEQPVTCEYVSLSDSLGRVLAEDVFSDMDMPPFDKSAVDGYACRTRDLHPAAGLTVAEEQKITTGSFFSALRIVETIPAGTIPENSILPGQCSKIMTGAMVPSGADCVVMVEDSEMTGNNMVRLGIVGQGKNICYRGEDIKTGDRVLQKGLQITPAHVAVMAATGYINPLVAKLPKVGIISTGDELVEPGIVPGTAQIRNSNAWQLEAQIRSVPARPCYHGIIKDDGDGLRKIIDLALSENDVVLITGGVSMGDFDFVPAILDEAGIEIMFQHVAIQPGKPTVFGRRNNRYVFGLPGNPVSSFVLFELMVRPFLLHSMGCISEHLELKLPMGTDFSRRKSDRKSLIPVILRDGAVFPVEYHGSAHINAYTDANGIMIMDIGADAVKKGELVHVRPL